MKRVGMAGGVILLSLVVGLAVLRMDDWRIGLVLGCAAFAVTTAAMVRRLRLAVLVLLALLPFSEYPSMVWPGLGLSALGPAAIAWATAAWALWRLAQRGGGHQWSQLTWLVGALLAWIGALVFHPDTGGTQGSLEAAAMWGAPMALFFVSRSLPWDRPGFSRPVGWTILGTGALVSVIGLRQYFGWLTSSEEAFASFVNGIYGDIALRVFATFRGNWQLACYLGLVLIVLVGSWRSGASWGGWALAAGCAALLGTTLGLTFARGPMVALIPALAAVWVARGWQGSMEKWRVWTVTLVLLTVAIVTQGELLRDVETSETVLAPLAGRVRTLAEPLRDEAVQVRLETWRVLSDLVVTSPFGIGLGSTGGLSVRHGDRLRFGAIHPDNFYLDAALNTGWVGLALFLAIAVTGLRRALRLAVRQGLPGAVGRTVLGWLVLILTASFTNQFTTNAAIGGYLWLALGALDRAWPGSDEQPTAGEAVTHARQDAGALRGDAVLAG